MERFKHWIRKIIKEKWKQCRSFCVRCKYYNMIKNSVNTIKKQYSRNKLRERERFN